MRRRLRSERQRQGLSLRRLAAEVGISPSALSQIETGKSRPSVATLYAIVTALRLSLDELLPAPGADGAPAPELEPFIVRAADRATRDADGRISRKRLSAIDDPVKVLWICYEPGPDSETSHQFGRHAGLEYGVVLSGRLAVSIRFETYELEPGDAISFLSAAPHRLAAVGDVPAVAVWVLLDDDRSEQRRRPPATPRRSP